MIAEIICIGDEILLGQIVNTNATWLSRQLTALGVRVKWITVVGDDFAAIHKVLYQALNRADVVISTGGLGPTHDDVSKKAICDFFQSRLVFNEAVFKNIEQIFIKMGRTVDQPNREQALVPEMAQVLNNRIGTAPGLMIQKNEKLLFVLPGVPMEMKAIFEDHIRPRLASKNVESFIRYKTIRTTGIFESDLYKLTQDLIESLEGTVEIASLPGPAGVNLRLMVRTTSREQADALLEDAVQLYKNRLENYIYGYDDDLLEEKIADYFIRQQKDLAICDAFTAGAIGQKLYSLKNAGKFVKGCLLFSEKETVFPGLMCEERRTFRSGSYFEKDSLVIARCIKRQFQADYGLAVLPQFPEDEKIVIIHAALTDGANDSYKTCQIRLERTDNQLRAAQFALNFLRLKIVVHE